MTNHEQLLVKLAMCINAKPEKSQLALLARRLDSMPIEWLVAACDRLARTEKFWPAEATIREAVRVAARLESDALREQEKRLALPEPPPTPEMLARRDGFLRDLRAMIRSKRMPTATVRQDEP